MQDDWDVVTFLNAVISSSRQIVQLQNFRENVLAIRIPFQWSDFLDDRSALRKASTGSNAIEFVYDSSRAFTHDGYP